MNRLISLSVALLLTLMPSNTIFASQTPEDTLQQIIENAKSKLDNGSLEELIDSLNKVSNGIVEFEKSKDIKSIRLTGKLNKDTYYLGEKINLDGLKLMATFSDGTNKEMPIDTIEQSDIYLNSQPGSPNIIPYDENTEDGVYQLILKVGSFYVEGDIYITLDKPVVFLTSISIKSMPKTEYVVSEALDITGLVVEGVYSNGNKNTISNSLLTITGFDPNKSGEQVLTIEFAGKITTYTVNVKETQKPDVPGDVKIDRLVYTPKGGFAGEISLVLTEPTETTLQLRDFSVHCPGLSEMTIENVSTKDNKTYKISTPIYRDNTYILEVYFEDKTLEGSFVVKSNCPIVSYPYITRTSDDKATFKFNVDEEGSLYYLVKEANTRLRAVSGVPTETELKNAKEFNIVAGPNEIDIDYVLKANVAYELYYMTSKSTDTSVVYGPVNITSEVEKSSTSDIAIVEAKSQYSDMTQDVVITLSKATEQPLTLEAFKIVCPAGSTLRFDTIVNGTGSNKNKVYTLKMMGGFYDNNYEMTVTFPDGTYTKGSFRSELSTPNLTSFIITRTSETAVKIVFTSSKPGYIYYGVSNERYKRPSVTEVATNAPKQQVHIGKNTMVLDNISNDSVKFFYWLSENMGGVKDVYVDGGGDHNSIPVEIAEEEKPEQESKIKIESLSLLTNKRGIWFTLSEGLGGTGLVNYELTFSGDNGEWPRKYMMINPDDSQGKSFSITSMGYPLKKGVYTLKINFKDGVAKKDITLTEDIAFPQN